MHTATHNNSSFSSGNLETLMMELILRMMMGMTRWMGNLQLRSLKCFSEDLLNVCHADTICLVFLQSPTALDASKQSPEENSSSQSTEPPKLQFLYIQVRRINHLLDFMHASRLHVFLILYSRWNSVRRALLGM